MRLLKKNITLKKAKKQEEKAATEAAIAQQEKYFRLYSKEFISLDLRDIMKEMVTKDLVIELLSMPKFLEIPEEAMHSEDENENDTSEPTTRSRVDTRQTRKGAARNKVGAGGRRSKRKVLVRTRACVQKKKTNQ